MTASEPLHFHSPRYGLMLVFNEQVRLAIAFDALWADPSLDGPFSCFDERAGTRLVGEAGVKEIEAVGYATIGQDSFPCLGCSELWPETPAKVLSLWLHADDALRLGRVADDWLAGLGRRVWPMLHFSFGIVADSFLRDYWEYQTNPLLDARLEPRVPRQSYGLLLPARDSADIDWHPPSA